MRATALLLSLATLITAATTTVRADDAAPSTPAKTLKDPKKKSDVSLPARVPAFIAGTIVGIPVAIVRISAKETVSATKDLVGDTGNPIILAAGGTLGLPAGVIAGLIGGTALGIKNAWVGSGDEPFGKDSFSLGDMD